MKFNILKNFDKSCYFSYPYPHFVIRNAIDLDLYKNLEKEYLVIENYFQQQKAFKKNNVRMQFNQLDLDHLNLDIPNWREFLIYHSSETHFKNMQQIFESDLNKIYPGLSEQISKNLENFKHFCQPGINTPVNKRTTVRMPHLDKYDTLFTGLLYLKNDKDNSKGGDFEIYESKKENYFYRKAEVSNLNSIKKFKTVKYEKNTFVGLLNTKNSIHSVSKRSKTNLPRRLVNFISKVPPNLSPLYSTQKDTNYARILKNKIRDSFVLGR